MAHPDDAELWVGGTLALHVGLDGPVPTHTIVDITTTFDTKMRALAAHKSQAISQHFGPMAETLTRLWGARAGVARAEGFVPLAILGRLLPGTLSL
jgi:LmbE family N-acetylglucosaminyl deacetylase